MAAFIGTSRAQYGCHRGWRQGKDLKVKIEDLVTRGFLTRAGADILQKLRLMGNEAVHEMKRHDTRTLGTAFDVVEILLQNVHIFSAEFD